MSEREEEFLDLPVALSGHAGLEDALKDSYIQLEQLNGSNQYQCSNCCKLVDATRVRGWGWDIVLGMGRDEDVKGLGLVWRRRWV